MSSKSSSVGIKNVAYLLVSQRARQRVQRLMLATPRTEAVRETEKVFLVYLIEDGDHGLLDDLVLQRRNPQRALPPIGLPDVYPSRSLGPVCAAMHPTMQANKAFLQIGLILLPLYAVDSGASFSLEGIKAFPQPINGQVVEECDEPHLLIIPYCFPHTRQPLGHAIPRSVSGTCEVDECSP
jgi:hypothetical protein